MNGIHWASYLFSGFAATLVLTTLLVFFQGAGLTRIDLPLMLGTLVTYNRDKAKGFGVLFHFLLGWIFSLIYVLAFWDLGMHPWWLGLLIGMIHALFILTIGMWILPSVHPRMASEDHGPDPTHQLEPPGYLALHYGRSTPIATLLAHLVYGVLLAVLYR